MDETKESIDTNYTTRSYSEQQPGPISNHDFLCPHGGINVATTRNVMGMVTAIPRIAWDALVKMYGTDGSPVVNITALESEKMDCSTCAVSCHMLRTFSHLLLQYYILITHNWCTLP